MIRQFSSDAVYERIANIAIDLNTKTEQFILIGA